MSALFREVVVSWADASLIATLQPERKKDGRKKKKTQGSGGGFQTMGLSYAVMKGVLHMGYDLLMITSGRGGQQEWLVHRLYVATAPLP